MFTHWDDDCSVLLFKLYGFNCPFGWIELDTEFSGTYITVLQS